MNIRVEDELAPLTPQTYHILLALSASNVMAGADVIRQMKADTKMDAQTGTVYPALKRLVRIGLIDNVNGNRQLYEINSLGVTILKCESERLMAAAKLTTERLSDRAAEHAIRHGARPEPALPSFAHFI
jgi:DNA-binding PadR family transcriptional regulator